MKHKYIVYNLKVISDFILSGLFPVDSFNENEIDVSIVNDRVPDFTNEDFSKSKDGISFIIPEYVKGYVENGNIIIIEPLKNILESELTQIILITAFYKLLSQRGYLTLHGSSVLINNKSIIFVGDSGSGKTSISLALRRKGYQFMADDVSVISYDDDHRLFVRSTFPLQRIKTQTAIANNIDTSNLRLTDFEEEKYYLPVVEGYIDTNAPLVAVFEIKTGECENVNIKEIVGISKLPLLINHTHGLDRITLMGLRDTHFKRCAEIAKDIPIFSIIRPMQGNSIDKQIELVMDTLKNMNIKERESENE